MEHNKFIQTDNKSINELLLVIESLNCFSEKFQNKIVNLAIWIATNHKGKEKEILQSITDLYQMMKALKIFDELFTENVKFLLLSGLKVEMRKVGNFIKMKDENKIGFEDFFDKWSNVISQIDLKR